MSSGLAPRRRLAARNLHQTRLFISVKQGLATRLLALFALQCRIKPLFDKTLANAEHRTRGALERLASLLVAPVRAGRVHL